MKFNNQKTFIYLLVVFLMFSCNNKQEVQRPKKGFESNFLDKSIENGISRETAEKKYIEQWVSKNDKSNFQSTSDGFWIRYDVKNSNPKAKPLNFVRYTAELSDIEGTQIYSFEEFGIKNAILTKSNEIRGIEKALYLMGKDEQTTLLLTSFNGYGIYGDENKIGKNQVLKVKLKLLDVKEIN